MIHLLLVVFILMIVAIVGLMIAILYTNIKGKKKAKENQLNSQNKKDSTLDVC